MSTYGQNHIQEIPLSSPYFRNQVKRFLEANGLRMESLDAYYAFTDDSGEIVAGAGIAGDVLKCLAVGEAVRSEGLLVPLVSRILSQHPGENLKVFTKPEYQDIFESLGFRLIARAPLAILLENGRGLEKYCTYLRSQARQGRCGVVVMNANPFTLGHLYLLEQAAARVDFLYVIPVKEDCSDFPYGERLAMIKSGAASLDKVMVLEGSDYVISASTFPTYFLKDLSDAAQTQMQLDTDLYGRWIAPALGAAVRFVGSEPFDALTARYNGLIPGAVVIPRLEMGEAVSASRVRGALSRGSFREASALCPPSSRPYLLAALAQRALLRELDTPGKPGLVGPDGPGAHKDMDYALMLSGIRALRPFWSRIALCKCADELRELGIEAEKAMLAATGGVNTHRGAIFCFGLVLNALGADFSPGVQAIDIQQFIQRRVHAAVHRIFGKSLTDRGLRSSRSGGADVRGALAMADEGYRELFEDWLPFYNMAEGVCFSVTKKKADVPEKQTPSAELLLLLRIMATLDDTCVIKRAGKDRAGKVKEEAGRLLEDFTAEGWKEMYDRYALEGISPGGAADMLALTIFIDSLLYGNT